MAEAARSSSEQMGEKTSVEQGEADTTAQPIETIENVPDEKTAWNIYDDESDLSSLESEVEFDPSEFYGGRQFPGPPHLPREEWQRNICVCTAQCTCERFVVGQNKAEWKKTPAHFGNYALDNMHFPTSALRSTIQKEMPEDDTEGLKQFLLAAASPSTCQQAMTKNQQAMRLIARLKSRFPARPGTLSVSTIERVEEALDAWYNNKLHNHADDLTFLRRRFASAVKNDAQSIQDLDDFLE